MSFKKTFSKYAAILLLLGCASQAVLAQAPADDAATAAKLKGKWTGKWDIGNYDGKFVLVVSATEGAKVTGEAQWYGTAAGDTKEALKDAVVKDGTLVAPQPGGTSFKLKLKDEKTLNGTWELNNFSGGLNLTRD